MRVASSVLLSFAAVWGVLAFAGTFREKLDPVDWSVRILVPLVAGLVLRVLPILDALAGASK